MKAIYAIRCKANGKMYIGKTEAARIRARINQHLQYLERNSHNYHFQKDFNKYGKDAFEYRVLEIYDEREADEIDFHRLHEYEWMKIYRTTDKKYGYNTEDKAAIAYIRTDEILIDYVEGLPPFPESE